MPATAGKQIDDMKPEEKFFVVGHSFSISSEQDLLDDLHALLDRCDLRPIHHNGQFLMFGLYPEYVKGAYIDIGEAVPLNWEGTDLAKKMKQLEDDALVSMKGAMIASFLPESEEDDIPIAVGYMSNIFSEGKPNMPVMFVEHSGGAAYRLASVDEPNYDPITMGAIDGTWREGFVLSQTIPLTKEDMQSHGLGVFPETRDSYPSTH